MVDFAGKTVALDFDGVLHGYESGWTGPVPTDPPVPGALAFVHMLIANGARIIIFSSRAAGDAGYAGILAWLRKHGFPPNIEVTAMKPAAVAYVDDRAVRFRRTVTGHGNWEDAFDQVVELLERTPRRAKG